MTNDLIVSVWLVNVCFVCNKFLETVTNFFRGVRLRQLNDKLFI